MFSDYLLYLFAVCISAMFDVCLLFVVVSLWLYFMVFAGCFGCLVYFVIICSVARCLGC